MTESAMRNLDLNGILVASWLCLPNLEAETSSHLTFASIQVLSPLILNGSPATPYHDRVALTKRATLPTTVQFEESFFFGASKYALCSSTVAPSLILTRSNLSRKNGALITWFA
jgi:hypothetical protein